MPACIDLYGILACHVAQRTDDVGMRMVLGAQSDDVARQMICKAMSPAIWGVAVAMPFTLALPRAIRSIVYGIRPHDPVVVIEAFVLVSAVAAFLAWIPARGAAKIDPTEALRRE